jgi:hypothetical protein
MDCFSFTSVFATSVLATGCWTVGTAGATTAGFSATGALGGAVIKLAVSLMGTGAPETAVSIGASTPLWQSAGVPGSMLATEVDDSVVAILVDSG